MRPSPRSPRSPRSARTTVIRFAVAATIAVVMALLPTATAHAGPSADYENGVLRYTNIERDRYDRVALKAQSCVDSYAEKQASRMAKARRMYHQDLGPILRGCKLRMVGENVAYGYPTAKSAVAAWMKSPGHRANILNSGYRYHGVGAAQGSDGRWYVAVVFGTKA